MNDISTIQKPKGVIPFSKAMRPSVFDIPRIRKHIPSPGAYNPEEAYKKVYERPKTAINYGKSDFLQRASSL